MMETKREIRARILRKRRCLTPEWVRTNSQRIVAQLIKLPEFKLADTVCLYMALPGEVRVDEAMPTCWQAGKRVLVPAYNRDSKSYGFKPVKPQTKMAAGLWNVAEPLNEEWAAIEGRSIIVVPGVAFDDEGSRVGHGKGYYDQLLTPFSGKNSCNMKIGVCFDFQRVEKIACEPWDIAMDRVLTEKELRTGTRSQQK